MFDNERYITCGISDRVPEDLQVAIWSAIELQKKFCSKLDYLQVFTFQKIGEDTLAIRQTQENPNFGTTHYTNYKQEYEEILNEKIFVNGAYFEEGYAMGLGKTVIQLCKEETKLHFDIAQKNTIMWKKEEEIPQMLTNRIKATID